MNIEDVERLLDGWIKENVRPTDFDDEAMMNELVDQCMTDGRIEGLSNADMLHAASGDLLSYMRRFTVNHH
jgi:hypothetical protein